jgi:acyl carrier protein
METGVEYVAPISEIEEKLSNIWKSLLDVNRVGMNDNFFDMGGDSIILVKAHAEISKLTSKKVKIIDLFNHPTISKLAQFIQQDGQVCSYTDKLEAIHLPQEYFSDQQDGENILLEFHLSDSLCEQLKNVSFKEEVKIETILISAYAYTFAKLTNSENITIQAMINAENEICPLDVDFENSDSFLELFKTIEKTFYNTDKSSYHIQDISRMHLERNKTSIIPLFYNVKLLTEGVDLLQFFDLSIGMSYENDSVAFTFEYRNDRLSKDKMESLTALYRKLLAAIME